MADVKSFYAKVTAFFDGYLKIPKDTYFYEQDGILTGIGIKTCVQALLNQGVFSNANDMKTEALKHPCVASPEKSKTHDKYFFTDVNDHKALPLLPIS